VSAVSDPKNPNAVAASGLGDSYRLNECHEQGVAAAQVSNPARPGFSCSLVDEASLVPGDVVWGAVRYIDYAKDDQYTRGCLNECALPTDDCKDVAPGVSGCIYDKNDFGRKKGCAEECDGRDNDGDGQIDNGTNGLNCDTGLKGVCANGLTKCQNGKLSCEGTQPGTLVERCDEIDQDCDGDPAGGTLNPIPEVGQVCTNAEVWDDTDKVYKPLTGSCAFGKVQCAIDQGTNKHRLICVSDTAAQASTAVELPCDNIDNNCDGTVDETRTVWEGDNPATSRLQCSDHIDNNCDGITDAQPAGSTFAQQLANHTVEICRNKVDDDCDHEVDESYAQVNASITGPACAWPCHTEGAEACSQYSSPMPVDRERPADITNNPVVPWFFDPPWFNDFWKVIKCVNGYWQIEKVCGLDDPGAPSNPSALPRSNQSWGRIPDQRFCVPNNTNNTAACSATPAKSGDRGSTYTLGGDTSVLQCYPQISGSNCPALTPP
jgi:hypothetical protein